MPTLDALFPNPQDCYLTLFQDAIFEHDGRINYVIEKNQLKRRNLDDVVKKIAAMADALYDKYGRKKCSI